MTHLALKPTLLFCFICIFAMQSNAQIRISRLNDKQFEELKNILPGVHSTVKKIQDYLDSNNRCLLSLSSGEESDLMELKNITPLTLIIRQPLHAVKVKNKHQPLVDTLIMYLQDYKMEYINSVEKYNTKIKELAEYQSQIQARAREKEREQFTTRQEEQRSAQRKRQGQAVEEQKKNPYAGMENNLDGISKFCHTGEFTVFIGIDMYFAYFRLNRFLQNDIMQLAQDSESSVFNDNLFSIKYIPRISSKQNEYLQVKFHTKFSEDKISYIQTDDGKTRIITKVELEGSINLIVKLFSRYWNYNLELGGTKAGTIANYQIMGDNIALSVTPRPNIALIRISEDNIKDFDYYKTFKIQ